VPASEAGLPPSLTTFWAAEALPSYIAQTADAEGNTGVNILTAPQNIEVTGMAFQTNQLNTGILIEKAKNCSFSNVDVFGPLTTADLTVSTDNTKAIDWSSTSSLPCTQIVFDNCRFSGFTYGINTAQQIDGAVISNGQFDTMYQGVVLGGASPVNGGATGVRVMHNVFDDVYEEGIYINGVSLNASGYNIFYDVGNHFLGTTSPAAPVITIDAINNVSVGDMFQRTTAYSGTYPRIKIYATATGTIPASIGIDSAAQIQMGSFVRQTGEQATITAGATNTTLFTVSSTFIKAFKMDYTIIVETSARTGTMTIANDADDSAGDGLSYTDDYVENSDTGIALSVDQSGDTVSLLYTATNTGTNAIMTYSITYLA
jgi:hypothetical protein